MIVLEFRVKYTALQELLWVKRKFEHRIGFLRTRIEAVQGNLGT